MSVLARARAQLLHILYISTHLSVPHGENTQKTVLYIQKQVLCMSRAEWMNGICLIWSRGRLISPSLPACRRRQVSEPQLAKATHGPKSRGKSFGTTLWHHVQKYCCLGVLFAHAQLPFIFSSYHIRRNEMNCIGSSEYMTVFTSFTRASFQHAGGSVIQLQPFCLAIAATFGF